MRNLLNCYFSANAQSMGLLLAEVRRANVTFCNGREGQEKRDTRRNSHATYTTWMPGEKLIKRQQICLEKNKTNQTNYLLS